MNTFTYFNRDRRGGHGATELKGSFWEAITPKIRKVQKKMVNRRNRHQQQKVTRDLMREAY